MYIYPPPKVLFKNKSNYYLTSNYVSIECNYMTFEAKLRKIGSTQGIYIRTDVITKLGKKLGDVITFSVGEEATSTNVITEKTDVITEKKEVAANVITPKEKFAFRSKGGFNTRFCKKHSVMMGSCGCL